MCVPGTWPTLVQHSGKESYRKIIKKNKVGKSKNFILDLSPYDKLEKIDPFLWPHGMVLFPFKNFGNKGISYID